MSKWSKVICAALCLALLVVGCAKEGSTTPEASLSDTSEQNNRVIVQGIFSGTWKRTNILESQHSTITIRDETKATFFFTVEAYNGAIIESTEGVAHISNGNEAMCEYNDNGSAVVTFTVDQQTNLMTVTVTNNSALGFGSGVSMDGVYTKGDPTYIQLETAQADEEKGIDWLLGEDAGRFVDDIKREGTLNETIKTSEIEGYMERYTVLAAGIGADILTGNNGHFYVGLTGYDENYVFYTDDPAYRQDIPSDFDGYYTGEPEIYYRGR